VVQECQLENLHSLAKRKSENGGFSPSRVPVIPERFIAKAGKEARIVLHNESCSKIVGGRIVQVSVAQTGIEIPRDPRVHGSVVAEEPVLLGVYRI
jgi:hypothetical protein